MKVKHFQLWLIIAILISNGNLYGQESTIRSEIPTKYFKNFTGTYEAPDSLRKRHSSIGDRPMVTIAFDKQERTVHLVEAHATGNISDRVLEGFAFWNPVTGHVEFYSYNSESDFLFKGIYSLLKNDTLQRTYDVYYPPGHDYYKRGLAVLSFRETFTLSEDQNILYNTVEYFSKADNKWLFWSNSAMLRKR